MSTIYVMSEQYKIIEYDCGFLSDAYLLYNERYDKYIIATAKEDYNGVRLAEIYGSEYVFMAYALFEIACQYVKGRYSLKDLMDMYVK